MMPGSMDVLPKLSVRILSRMLNNGHPRPIRGTQSQLAQYCFEARQQRPISPVSLAQQCQDPGSVLDNQSIGFA